MRNTQKGLVVSLIKFASKVSAFTMLSRVIGFVRDTVFAMSFGAKSGFDIFLLAFRIPNMMRRIFAEGAFSQAFIPVLAEYETKTPEEKQSFMNAVYSCLVLVTIALSVIVCGGCELVLRFGSGWLANNERMVLFFRLLQITFPYLVLITITGYYTAALQAKKHFTMAAFAPSFFNIILTAGAYLSSIYLAVPIYGAAATVMLGGFLQVGLMLYSYQKLYGLPTMVLFQLNPGIFKMLKLMCAGMYGASVAQIGISIDTIILSTLATGSISWIYYAERLSYLPLGVFGVSIATVLSPSLAKSSQSGNQQAFQKQIAWGFVTSVMIAIPAAIGLGLLAEPIVMTLFYRGKFTLEDVAQTAAALQIFAIGIPAYMWVKVFAGAFYARQETWIPVQCATWSLAINVVVGVIGSYLFAHVGIACAVATSAYVNAGLLYWRLKHENIFAFEQTDLTKVSKVCGASLCTLIGVWVIPPTSQWVGLTVKLQLSYLTAAMIIALSGYVMTLWSLALDWRSPEH